MFGATRPATNYFDFLEVFFVVFLVVFLAAFLAIVRHLLSSRNVKMLKIGVNDFRFDEQQNLCALTPERAARIIALDELPRRTRDEKRATKKHSRA